MDKQIEINTKSNNIYYKGEVKIQIVNNDRVLKTITKHNDGWTPLFIFICNCVADNFDRDYLPQIIKTYTEGGAKSIMNPIQKSYSVCKIDNNVPIANILFTIPGNMITGDIKKLKLFCNKEVSNDNNFSAEVTLDETITQDVTQGNNIIINWKLSFQTSTDN